MRTAALCLAWSLLPSPVALPGEGAPAWFVDRFEPRVVERPSGPWLPTIDLLGDGEIDVVVTALADGRWQLDLWQRGTLARLAPLPASAAETTAFARLAALPASGWLPFTFELGPDGRPVPTLSSLELAVGEAALVRTIRLSEGGGGAFALVRAADAETLQLEVLALEPALSRLPRTADDDVVAQIGARSGRVLLFPQAATGHPAWCSFDVLHADRDHLEWSAQRLREFTYEVPAPASATRVRARGLGGERCLELQLLADPAARDARAPAWLEWREVAADRLAPGDVAGHPIVVLDGSFEPRSGAFVVARDPARTSDLDPSLFSCASDERGEVVLPVERRADGAALEVVAFTVGPNARHGRRTGVQASVGGETVVLLEARERCTVAVTPPPGFLTWVGLDVASGHFRLPLPADGVLVLPALREPATLHLAEPYLARARALELMPDPAPESRLEITATFAPAR